MMCPEMTLESVAHFPPSFQDGFYFRTADPALCAGLISDVAPRQFFQRTISNWYFFVFSKAP